MKKRHQYVGFSTLGAVKGRRRDWKLYNNDLIRNDLILHFNTRLGERMGRPGFGCRLIELFMEQQTAALVDEIRAEVRRVIDSDARVLCQTVELYEQPHTVIIAAEIYNNLTQTSETMTFSFDARQGRIS